MKRSADRMSRTYTLKAKLPTNLRIMCEGAAIHLLHHLRGKKKMSKKLDRNKNSLLIAVHNIMKVWIGILKKQRTRKFSERTEVKTYIRNDKTFQWNTCTAHRIPIKQSLKHCSDIQTQTNVHALVKLTVWHKKGAPIRVLRGCGRCWNRVKSKYLRASGVCLTF